MTQKYDRPGFPRIQKTSFDGKAMTKMEFYTTWSLTKMKNKSRKKKDCNAIL